MGVKEEAKVEKGAQPVEKEIKQDKIVEKIPEPVAKETKQKKPVTVKKEETEQSVIKPAEKVTLPEGTIHLIVKKAKDLEKKGMFGKADPYTKITLGKQSFKSPTIDNNQNPEWNYNVTLELLKDSPEDLTLEVFDEDIVGKDDKMGSTKISLHQIVESKTLVNQWVKLKECKSGEVLISAEYLPVGAKPMEIKDSKMETQAPIKTEEPDTTAVKSEEKVTLPEGSIHLTVKKARNL